MNKTIVKATESHQSSGLSPENTGKETKQKSSNKLAEPTSLFASISNLFKFVQIQFGGNDMHQFLLHR